MFGENILKDNLNNERLTQLNYPLIEVPSLDKSLLGALQSKLVIVANRSQSQTGCLPKFFKFKNSSMVMLTTNASIDDR